MSDELTHEIVKSLFEYTSNGHLLWKVKIADKVNVGQRAGSKHNNGYWKIKIYGKQYLEHRLIWLYHNNSLPNCQIDHINRNKLDNRIENLRLCPRNERDNCQNLGPNKRNTSGYTGVSWSKVCNKWVVQISSDGKNKNIGYFSDINEAILARKEAEKKYHKFINKDE